MQLVHSKDVCINMYNNTSLKYIGFKHVIPFQLHLGGLDASRGGNFDDFTVEPGVEVGRSQWLYVSPKRPTFAPPNKSEDSSASATVIFEY